MSLREKSLGEFIRNLRGAKTQEQVEDGMKKSVAEISRYENDHAIPSNKTLEDFARFYGIDVKVLIELKKASKAYKKPGRPRSVDPSEKASEYRISMTPKQIADIDESAQNLKMNRSEYLRYLNDQFNKSLKS